MRRCLLMDARCISRPVIDPIGMVTTGTAASVSGKSHRVVFNHAEIKRNRFPVDLDFFFPQVSDLLTGFRFSRIGFTLYRAYIKFRFVVRKIRKIHVIQQCLFWGSIRFPLARGLCMNRRRDSSHEHECGQHSKPFLLFHAKPLSSHSFEIEVIQRFISKGRRISYIESSIGTIK